MLKKSRQSLRTINISLDSGEEKIIISNGNFIKYETGTGNIRIRTNEGVDVIRDVGSKIKISEFTEVHITNLHTANDAKTITIGYGDVSDNAVSGTIDVDNITNLEVVEILERDKTSFIDTLENENTFMMGVHKGAVSSKYCQLGLHNPIASGINLIVQKVLFSGVGTSIVYFYDYVTTMPGATLTHGFNKFINGSVSIANTEKHVSGTIYGVNKLGTFSLLSNTTRNLIAGDNIIIPPGNGILSQLGIVSADARCTFEWKEVTI